MRRKGFAGEISEYPLDYMTRGVTSHYSGLGDETLEMDNDADGSKKQILDAYEYSSVLTSWHHVPRNVPRRYSPSCAES